MDDDDSVCNECGTSLWFDDDVMAVAVDVDGNAAAAAAVYAAAAATAVRRLKCSILPLLLFAGRTTRKQKNWDVTHRDKYTQCVYLSWYRVTKFGASMVVHVLQSNKQM